MANNPTLLTMPIAENGAKNTIPATQAAAGDGLLSQSTGFPPETALPLGAGGKAPTREDFNGALNLLSNLAFYSQKGWTFQYDENQAYYKGCIVMDATDGLRYECINDVEAGEILPSEDTQNEYWREYSPGGVPLGSIIPYAANAETPPYSFLFCEGQAVSRTMYPDLFDLIGVTYGAGDGSTTFNLPNMIGKYPQGDTTAGTTKAAGLPNITGSSIPSNYFNNTGSMVSLPIDSATGAFYTPYTTQVQMRYDANATSFSPPSTPYRGLAINASRSSSIYGNSDTVTPPTLTVRWIIKAYDAPTPSSAQIDLSQYAQALADAAVPAGMIIACAGDTARTGYLLCDGSAVSRTTYSALYAVIGIKYGSGDGSTTFNLPNFIDKYPQGASTAGTVKAAGVPNITGQAYITRVNFGMSPSGAFKNSGQNGPNDSVFSAGAGKEMILDFDASRANPIYGASDTVTPPTLTVRYMIKYA